MTYRVLIEKFSGHDGDEVSILDANGVTVLDARDAALAERVVALLNGAPEAIVNDARSVGALLDRLDRLDRLERMERLLRGLEWNADDSCPKCGSWRLANTHQFDCEFAALLENR